MCACAIVCVRACSLGGKGVSRAPLYKGSLCSTSAASLQIFTGSLLHHHCCSRLCSSVTMTSLLTALGTVLCFLTVSSEIMPQADFNPQEMAGKWYLIGFATNAQWFTARRASMKMGTAIYTPTADGDLDMSYASLTSDGSCWRMSGLAKKTDMPGRFRYTSASWENDNDMRVVDVKYDEYALTHTIKTKGSDITIVNKLYGRGVHLSPDLLEKFRQFSLETGILPGNVAFLPRIGECPSA